MRLLETMFDLVMMHKRSGLQTWCHGTHWWSIVPSHEKYELEPAEWFLLHVAAGPRNQKNLCVADFLNFVILPSFNRLVDSDAKIMITCRRTNAAARSASHHGGPGYDGSIAYFRSAIMLGSILRRRSAQDGDE